MNEQRFAVTSRADFLEKSLPLVRSIANKYKTDVLSLEDLIQEGFLGILEAERKYDASKGVQFNTYASYWVKKYVLAAIRNEIDRSNRIDFLEEDVVQEIAELKTKEAKLLENGCEDSQVKGLDDAEQKVYYYSIVEQKSLSEIAELMNISRERVRQIKQKLIRKIKAGMLHDSEISIKI